MANPPTKVTWYTTTLHDEHPAFGKLSVTLPYCMECMLTDVAPVDPTVRGSRPNNTALWWPYFKRRHQIPRFSTYWVQGHLLNDNVWGPGDARNLLPISNTLNTNMLNLVERAIKNYVKAGKVLRYVVKGHWDQSPAKTREVFGLIDDGTGSLLWGEQFAPTRLSWQLYELSLDSDRKLLQTPLLHGSPWYSDRSQWNDNFPN